MNKTKPKVSVIMRCKNSDWVIAQAISALFSQTFRDFELLVVDSGSTDRTLEIVKEFPCKIIEIEAKRYFPGAVLNMAIKETTGDIIVFQNSDAVPLCQHTLERLVSAFNSDEIKAAFTRQIPRPEAKSWVRRDYTVSFPDKENTPSWITLSLPMAAMRRSVWEKHPFYNDAWASEDTEWGNWANRNGVKIKYVKDAIIMHSHNYTLKQIYGRKFVEGEADIFIYNSNPSFYRTLKNILKSIGRDVLSYLKNKDILSLPKIPLKNIVYNWAYYKGQKLGLKRKRTGDKDIAKGQIKVLSRY